MARYLCFLFFITCPAVTIFGQGSLTGKVIDTAEKRMLSDAVVVLMNEKDSMLVAFARTDAAGQFTISSTSSGRYIILVSLKNYSDYTQFVSLSNDQAVDIGQIPLITVAHLLEEVIVRQTISKIRIKGDTTEYRADSFYVGPNATVEELLKVLPGITVDAKGNITANGKRITEVLVDGEPFFGDDPVLVTRNLRSEMVNKVQVYDKKTDREAFTGVSTGPPKTVIDLKIKQAKKNGFFGNTVVGGGTGGFYNTEFMYNKFSGKEKISFFGVATNTAGAGLSDLNIQRYSDNSVFTNVREMIDPFDNWPGNYNGAGLPRLHTAGIHYSNKWNGDTQSVNFNYKFARLNVEGQTLSNMIQALPDGKRLESNSGENYNNTRMTNRANGFYQFIPDSTSTIKLVLDAHTSQKKISGSLTSQTRENGTELLNSLNRGLALDNGSRTFFGDLVWLKKFKKKRRTMTVGLTGEQNSISSSGYLYALNYLYSGTTGQAVTDTTDQFKQNNSGERTLSTTLSYTEPVSANAIVSIQMGQAYYKGNSGIQSFNRGSGGSYLLRDSANSSDFILEIPRQKLDIQYVLSMRKYRFSAGNAYNFDVYRQNNQHDLQVLKRRFVYNNPSVVFSYSPDAQTMLSLSYRGVTNLPTFQQLQPLIVNLNPVTRFVGNSDLAPSYSNSFNLSFLQFKMVKSQSMSVNLSYNSIHNAIGLSSMVDTFGRTALRWINFQGNYEGNGAVNFTRQIPGVDVFASLRASVQFDRSGSSVNGSLFYTNSTLYSAGLLLRKSRDRKYSISLGSVISYNRIRYNTVAPFEANFMTFQPNVDIDWYLAKRWVFHLDGRVLTRQQVQGFDRIPAVSMLNGWLSARFLQRENLVLKLAVNNILDANALNTRFVGPLYSSQTDYNVIGRYIMLSLAWNFVGNSTQSKAK